MLSEFIPNYDEWVPSETLLSTLGEMRLTRDKVEAVFAFYASDHAGQGPYASEIAKILGISKQNVERRMTELIAFRRAQRLHGKFVLVAGSYTHPAVRRLMGG